MGNPKGSWKLAGGKPAQPPERSNPHYVTRPGRAPENSGIGLSIGCIADAMLTKPFLGLTRPFGIRKCPRCSDELVRGLVLSVNTVKKHVLNLCGKLGVQSRAQAIARARRLHLL